MNVNRLQNPGDINMYEVVITSYTGAKVNVLPQMLKLDIIEDIYSNCLSGELTLADGVNLVNHLPIIGSETLTVTWQTPSLPKKTMTFMIYQVTERTVAANDTVQVYTLSFCSPEMIRSSTSTISRSFRGTPDSIARQMYNDYLKSSSKPLATETCQRQIQVVIPYWNPLRAINWLTTRAISAKNPNHCNYFFYETLDDFRFNSLSTLVANASSGTKVVYTSQPLYSRDETTGKRDVSKEFYNIKALTILEPFNQLKKLQDCTYSSFLVVHDITTKSIQYVKHEYLDTFDGVSRINKNPIIPRSDRLYTKKSSSPYQYYPKSTSSYSLSSDVDYPEKRVLQRNSLTNQNTQSIRIEVAGDTRRKVGEIIEVEIPSMESTYKKQQWKDVRVSGAYMITSIRHEIIKDNYNMTMELSRDSLPVANPDEKAGGAFVS